MNNSCIIIPSRLESQRFPNKPLIKIKDKSMIRHVLEKALLSLADLVVVATDSKKIYEECEGYSILTGKCSNGTERVIEAATKIEAKVYVNLQGDEPLVNPNDLNILIQKCQEKPGIHTLMTSLDHNEVPNNNIVKVFYRTQDDYNVCHNFSRNGTSSKHIGIYAFDKNTLLQIKNIKPSKRAISEKLEQLTWLDFKIPIYVWHTDHIYHAVDVPSDIDAVLQILNK